MDAGEFLGVEHLVAQRLAELGRAGLGLAERALRGAGEDQIGVERICRETVARFRAVHFLVGGAEIGRELLGKMPIGQLLGHDHGPGRHLHAFRGLAADTYEIRIDQRGEPIIVALEATIGQRQQRQRRLRRGSADQHAIRLGGENTQDLRGNRRIRARITLVGRELDVAALFSRLAASIDEIAPSVGKADVADIVHLVALHAVGDDLGHQHRRLRNRDRPLLGGIRRLDLDRRDRDHGNAEFVGDRRHRDRPRRSGGADQNIDLLFLDQLARIARRGGRIGAVVELDHRHGLGTDLALVFLRGFHPIGVGNAKRRSWTAERGDEAQFDFGLRRRGDQQRGDGDCGKSVHHSLLRSNANARSSVHESAALRASQRKRSILPGSETKRARHPRRRASRGLAIFSLLPDLFELSRVSDGVEEITSSLKRSAQHRQHDIVST